VASLAGPSPTRDTPAAPRLSTRSPHPSPIPNPKKPPPPPTPNRHPPRPRDATVLPRSRPLLHTASVASSSRSPHRCAPSPHSQIDAVTAQPLQIATADGSRPHLRVSVLKLSPRCYPASSDRRCRRVDVVSASRRRRWMDAVAAQPRSMPHPSGVSGSTPPPGQHRIWQRQDAPHRRSSSVLFRSSTGDQNLQ
jgi:hypothetical protein